MQFDKFFFVQITQTLARKGVEKEIMFLLGNKDSFVNKTVNPFSLQDDEYK